MLKCVKDFIKAHKFITAIVVVVLGFAGYYFYSSSTGSQSVTRYVLAAAQKGTLIVSVSGSGQVSAVNQLDIKPQTSGTVILVNVQQGQDVKTGQVLAVLDQRNAAIALNQAKASLQSAQANYDKLLAGLTGADLQISQLSVQSAQNSLDNAVKNLDQVKKQQDNLVKNAYNSLMNSGITPVASPTNISTVLPAISGSYSGTEQGEYDISIYASTGGLCYNVSGLENANGFVTTNSISLGNRGLYIQFSNISFLRPNDSWTISIPNVKTNNYLSSFNAYQTALQNRDQAISNAENQIVSAQSFLDQAKANFALKTEPAAQSDIDAAKVQIDSANLQVQSAQKALSDTVVTAPFDGQLATFNIQKGDQASAGTVVATLVTKQNLAKVSLNEIDAAKAKVSQQATLTFDAIDGLNLTGKVVSIDTLGTVTQGVVSYGVQIGFDTQDDRIKPGMSVTAAIITEAKPDVILVPNSAIKTQAGQSYVEMPDATEASQQLASISQITLKTAPQMQAVQIGLANDTYTEIVSGLSDGQNVVTQTITGSSGTTSSNSTTRSSNSLGIPGLGGTGSTRTGGATFIGR